MGHHSILSPSSSSRWLVCPGSVRLTADTPDTSSDASREGTAAHELAAMCLAIDERADSFLGHAIMVDDREGGVDVFYVDEEMAAGVQQYLDYVRSLPGEHLIEKWFDLEKFTGEPGGGGTADHAALAVLEIGGVLYLTDFKYGRGPVEVVGNTQLRTYAAGLLDYAIHNGHTPVEVVLAIVQPRVYSEPQIEVIPVEELIAWVETVLVPGAEATRDPEAALVPSDKGCEWCRARGTCMALMDHALEASGTSLATLDTYAPPAPAQLTNEDLGLIFDKAALIKKWLEAVEVEVMKRMTGGEPVPGLKLVRGRKGNKKWNADEMDIARVLRDSYGLANETIFKHELLSPTQMLSLPVVKDNPALISALIAQSEGGIVVAPANDKRPAILPETTAQEAFNHL